MRLVRNVAIVAALFFGALLVVYNFDWQLAAAAFVVGGIIAGVALVCGFGDRPPQI
jgi:hypothetical protein